VNRRDGGLDVILGQLEAGGWEFEKPLPFGYKLGIPSRAILIRERAQIARCIEARRQARCVKTHQALSDKAGDKMESLVSPMLIVRFVDGKVYKMVIGVLVLANTLNALDPSKSRQSAMATQSRGS
jgi:hypothetical protein